MSFLGHGGRHNIHLEDACRTVQKSFLPSLRYGLVQAAFRAQFRQIALTHSC